jgi:protein associated with RNAse G/E
VTALNSSTPLPSSNEITVVVFKHDGSEYRRWHGQLVEQEGPLLVLQAEFEVDVSHHLLGEIKRGTRLIEYYWLDRWYNVFRFLNEDGGTRLFYCNINKPPAFDGQVLSYIDLDVDVIVNPDYSYQVQDLDEFEMNSERYGYTAEEKKNADKALEELIRMIQSRQFPFVSEARR